MVSVKQNNFNQAVRRNFHSFFTSPLLPFFKSSFPSICSKTALIASSATPLHCPSLRPHTSIKDRISLLSSSNVPLHLFCFPWVKTTATSMRSKFFTVPYHLGPKGVRCKFRRFFESVICAVRRHASVWQQHGNMATSSLRRTKGSFKANDDQVGFYHNVFAKGFDTSSIAAD